MTGRFDPLAADRPVVRDLEGRAWVGVGRRSFLICLYPLIVP